MRRTFVIAKTAFKEIYRDRFFLVLVFGVILLFALSLLLGELSFEEHKKILFDLGLAAIHWLNLGLCLFGGGASIRKELERQTYMTLLATPLSRLELILGKFMGIFAVLITSTLILGGGLLLLLNSLELWRNFLVILLGVLMEAAIVLALSICASLLFSPFVSLFVSIGIFFTGHWLESLHIFAERSKSTLYVNFSEVISWGLPNLYRLNWRSMAILDNGLSVDVGFVSLIHGLAWVCLFLYLANLAFRRKNLM